MRFVYKTGYILVQVDNATTQLAIFLSKVLNARTPNNHVAPFRMVGKVLIPDFSTATVSFASTILAS